MLMFYAYAIAARNLLRFAEAVKLYGRRTCLILGSQGATPDGLCVLWRTDKSRQRRREKSEHSKICLYPF
jgi:hypothetical protein